MHNSGAICVAGGEVVPNDRHCEERELRSNPFFLCAARWIASLALAMTVVWLFKICIAVVVNPHGEEARQAPSRTMEARHSFTGLHPSRRLPTQAPQDEG
jgi:hypothetical protein